MLRKNVRNIVRNKNTDKSSHQTYKGIGYFVPNLLTKTCKNIMFSDKLWENFLQVTFNKIKWWLFELRSGVSNLSM